jgi:hypothetical protein
MISDVPARGSPTNPDLENTSSPAPPVATRVSRVLLNIGVVTSVATLCSRQGTMLDAMFSGNSVLVFVLQ